MPRSARLDHHPHLPLNLRRATVPFTFQGRALQGREGETIASALVAAGV
ncbi:MAG: 2Fe-2S iron-sulfur cluster-binding protein, partial [Planctomycetota bacterium]